MTTFLTLATLKRINYKGFNRKKGNEMFIAAWLVSGFLFGVWGYYLSQDKQGLPVVPGMFLCTVFGPISITALIEVWHDNWYVTGIPWYKQGHQMQAEYARHKTLAATKKEELLQQCTISQVYVVVLSDGKTIKQGMQYVPHVSRTNAPEYYYCWDTKSQKCLQKDIVAKLQKRGVIDGEIVHPWHTVVEVIFE